MKTIIRAVYRDEHGRTYSAPVEFHGDKWLMRTSEGLQPIEHFFDDDNAGRLTFDHHREDPEGREEPEAQSAESRLPHENSFQQLHRVAANRDAESLRHQEHERQRLLEQLNQPNARIAQMAEMARQQRNEIAASWKPPTGEK